MGELESAQRPSRTSLGSRRTCQGVHRKSGEDCSAGRTLRLASVPGAGEPGTPGRTRETRRRCHATAPASSPDLERLGQSAAKHAVHSTAEAPRRRVVPPQIIDLAGQVLFDRAPDAGIRLILRMVSAEPARDLPLDRLVVKSGGSTRFVRVADIEPAHRRKGTVVPGRPE